MSRLPGRATAACILVALLGGRMCLAAYDLEVPANPWDEYRLQYRQYTQLLLKSYDRAFANDYEGAVREATAAVNLLPDEGLAYADRARLNLTLNRRNDAESDFKKALSLFGRALDRYRPGMPDRGRKGARPEASELAKLTATTRYQRGEAYFSLEQYRDAKDDFAAACQGGSALACSRMWDVTQVEKRGLNWVPLFSRQFYDRQRVTRPSRDLVRVWVRREGGQLSRSDGGVGEAVHQHLELNCGSREFRLLEAFSPGSATRGGGEVNDQSGFIRPIPGSAAGKLLVMLCASP